MAPTAFSDSSDRRGSLRAATQHLHRDLDELVANFDLTAPGDYRRFLRASAAALLGIEAFLERSGVEHLLPDWQERARSQAILSDLRTLKAVATPFELRRAAATTAEMFGMLYVLEGSRLGARLLREHVMSSSDATVRMANAYLSANDPRLWRTFLQRLENSAEAGDGAEATGGAVFAFSLFQRAFSLLDAEP